MKPRPDPLIVATKRIRSRTTLGQLEALLAERRKTRARITRALTQLDKLDARIAALGKAMALPLFETQLQSQISRSSTDSTDAHTT